MTTAFRLTLVHRHRDAKTVREFTAPVPFGDFAKGEWVEFHVDGERLYGVIQSRSFTLEVQDGRLLSHTQRLDVERVGPL